MAAAAGVGVTWLVASRSEVTAAGTFFATVAAFTLVAGVARLGAPTSLVYWPARLRAEGQHGLLGPCLRIGLVPVAVASVALGGLLLLAADPIAAVFADHDGRPATADALRALAPLLPAAVLTEALLATARGYRAVRPTIMLDRLLRPGLQLLAVGAVVGLWWAAGGPAPWVLALAWAVPYLPVAVLAGRQLRRVHTSAIANPTAPPPDQTQTARLRRRFWRFAGPRAVASVLQLALQRVDVLLVAALGGLAAAAGYAVASRFLAVGQLANQGISQAVQPRLAEALATGDTDRARDLFQTATGWLVLLAWPLHLSVLVAAPAYLGLFGDAYRDGAPAVMTLAAAMLLATVCGPVDMVLAMGGRTRWNLINVSAALAVMVLISLLLIPRLGALGAAVGLAAAVAVNNLAPLAQVRRAVRVHPFGAGTRAAAALAAGCFGVVPLASVALGGGALAGLAVGGLGYGAGVWMFRRQLAWRELTTLGRRPTITRGRS
ncbi:lipopolysaccharide biosynthesis protein [Pilimelia columellifera]|uniref:Polysaccharide biosynthesis protein C-terminal domain-containing protein n=1 Tax=Pilimelia columellifera subsp. columellifera TaxID=706583 RepID=A0ABN3NM58_9ACTN